MTQISWTHVTTTLGELKAWDGNPKKSTKKQKQQIAASFDELGQFSTVAISPDGDVYDGHQRLSALLAKYGDGYEVKALQSSRPLTDEERRKIAIYSRQIGAWDWDALIDWDIDELTDWGFDEDMLADLTADGDALGAMLEQMGIDEFEDGGEEQENKYSQKIEAPVYTPKGDKPELSELYDEERAWELIEEIESANIPDDEKEFLITAANRHTVLNFEKIAEYYAHASKEVQTLMENSALVIIDFNRAIELGYVRMSEAMREIQINEG